jgi:hypothetical protein
MEHVAFLDRVMSRMPRNPRAFESKQWAHGGRPTKEGVAIMPISGVDPAKVVDAVMDVDHYKGNIAQVGASRSIPDERYAQPAAVRFYQRVDIPLLGAVQHELVLHRMGERDGFHIAAWHLLKPETDRLNKRDGYRSDYNHGAWLVAPGIVAYALGSAPKRDDVGYLKFKALTRGADAAASKILKANMEGMARWAARR